MFKIVEAFDRALMESKWYIGASFIPQLSQNQHNKFFENAYTSSETEGANYIADESDVIRSVVSNSIAFQGAVGFKLSNHIELESGLYFSKINGNILSTYNVEQQLTTVNIVEFPVPARNGNGFTMITTSEESTVSNYDVDTLSTFYSVQTFELPVTVRYVGKLGKWSYFLSTGVSTVIHSESTVQSRSYLYNDINYENKYSTFKAPDINFVVGAGLGYQIGNGFELRLEPLFRRGLYTNENSVQNQNRQVFGLNSGFIYSF